MDEYVTISTPEQVAFQYEVAGIGSRFLAALLDHLILVVAVLLVFCGMALLVPAAFTAMGGDDTGVFIILGVLTILIFLILFGYFVLFEAVWHGQTPGKRVNGLRVIRRNGQPIGMGEAMIRNLVRLADFLPGFYGLGLVTMFIDRDARRLGDLAAGTIVVREGRQTRLGDVRVAPPAPQPGYAYPQPTYSPPAPYAPTLLGAPYDPLPGVSLREIKPEDYRLARELLTRVSRGEMSRQRGEELAERMAFGVAARIGHDFREWEQRGWGPLVFLQSVLAARDARGE